MNCAKTAEPIEMPFGVLTQVIAIFVLKRDVKLKLTNSGESKEGRITWGCALALYGEYH